MPTDRAAARGLIVGWIRHLRTAVDGAMQAGTLAESDFALAGVDWILEVLIRTPIQAEAGEADGEENEELATLAAVCRSRARFTDAFADCGKRAVRMRKARANYVPVVDDGTFYEAALELLDEMDRLANVLRERHHTAGNVTHILAGPQDPELTTAVELVRSWIRDFAVAMAKLMEAYDYTWADQALEEQGRIGGLTQRVRLIATVPYLARGGGNVPDELAPLVQVYQRGGKPAKAIRRCAGAAAETLKGLQGGMFNDFHACRAEAHAGMQQLIPALERLVEVIS